MAENKKNKHRCPEIDKDNFNTKMTGPAYTPGMTPTQARTAWFNWVRIIRSDVSPMPRRTY